MMIWSKSIETEAFRFKKILKDLCTAEQLILKKKKKRKENIQDNTS